MPAHFAAHRPALFVPRWDGRGSVNLLSSPQAFDQSPWLYAGTAVVADTNVAPDGTTTADRLRSANTASNIEVHQTFAGITGTTYAVSFFVAPLTTSWCYLGLSDFVAHRGVYFFDVTNGVVGSTQIDGSEATLVRGYIEQDVAGFYRCTSVIRVAGSSRTWHATLGIVDANGSTAVTLNKTLAIWGAQAEIGFESSPYQATP